MVIPIKSSIVLLVVASFTKPGKKFCKNCIGVPITPAVIFDGKASIPETVPPIKASSRNIPILDKSFTSFESVVLNPTRGLTSLASILECVIVIVYP